jgi:hypothetical protein
MKLERSDVFDYVWAEAPAPGQVGKPEIAALSMSGSSVIVALNAIALRCLHRRDRQHLPPVGGLLTADAQTFPGMAP